MNVLSAQEPRYRLESVVSHSGSGPHAGHYFAHVRSGDNRWYRMDDSNVSNMPGGLANVLGSLRNAYILFYTRIDTLASAINGKGHANGHTNGVNGVNGVQKPPSGGGQKRKAMEDEDDPIEDFWPESSSKPNGFIGPQQPNAAGRSPTSGGSNPFKLPRHSSDEDVGQPAQRGKTTYGPQLSTPPASPPSVFSSQQHKAALAATTTASFYTAQTHPRRPPHKYASNTYGGNRHNKHKKMHNNNNRPHVLR